ncbi:rRNA pseudouridine synthase [candidate division KSB1 bacterium]|nr:MAG: rRNA pseudouridine synthase [candidate division KSB1 bacterium]RPH96857.1 MAG: rRNA pseudouridine synthase [candidate division KSB1 bacterium]
MKERLQKIIAERGLASRRRAEILIREGRVSVNGCVLSQLGSTADPEQDEIRVNGRRLPQSRAPRVLALHKPVGYVCTCRTSRERGTSVLNLVPNDRRYFPVGRLDMNSSGLLLLTDDGSLAQRLSHPRYGVRKEYRVRTGSPVSPPQIHTLREGVPLEEGLAKVIGVSRLSKLYYRVILAEGKKRQIRRMFEALGVRVTALERIRIGGLLLGDLPPGKWRELNSSEISRLLSQDSDPADS